MARLPSRYMNLRQLHYLQLIVEKGSFAAAAQAAGVSQPAISQAIRALEREWNIALFEKQGRQKYPTRAALSAAMHMDELQARIGRFTAAATLPEDRHLNPHGTSALSLRVGMAPAAALLYGPTIAALCLAQQEPCQLQMVRGAAPEMLQALYLQELDLALVPCPRRWEARGIHRSMLYVSTPVVYCRSGHALAQAQSLMEMGGAAWAVSGRRGTAGNMIEEAHLVRGLAAPHIAVQCDSYAVMLNLVAHSDMLCAVPHPILLGEPPHAGLTALQLREGLPQYEVSLFWPGREQQRRPQLVQAVVQALKAQAAAANH